MAAKKPTNKVPKKQASKSSAKTAASSQLPLVSGTGVQPVQLQDEMERSFIDYAMSVIMSRALPDVRDGLKPVHRRIIWDMHQQGFRPDRPFVKCARVTGDTMARYHPHGDGAIYDALVRMAQPFSLRHPLIDFHGNYGSPDFGPAASRYTESRLHPLAMQLLADIDEDTVDLISNYDGTSEEPSVLPARFPNLLVNGSQGIAVGMATSIPPHNLGEVVDATLHLIDNPEASIADLMKFVKGPDFPTGGLILGRSGINEAFKTGRGSIKMRAKVAIEDGVRGQMRIVVTELPYQASCSAIAARIQELVDGGELDGIAEKIMQHLGKPHVIDNDEFRNIPDEHEIDKNTFFARSRLVDLHAELDR